MIAVPDVIRPVLVERNDPVYPKKAAKAGIEGTVIIEIVVGLDGKAHDARVVHSVDPELDRAALKCVEGWRFRPGMVNGEPVAVLATAEVNFRLEP